MKRLIALLTALMLLLAVAACAKDTEPVPTQPREPEPVIQPQPEPEHEPEPEPEPKPEGEACTVYADNVGVVYALLSRGEQVSITGELDGFYIVAIDDTEALVEKRLVRLESDGEYERWSGYASWSANVYPTHYMVGDALAVLAVNTPVTVVDDLGGCYVTEWEGACAYINDDNVSRGRYNTGGNPGGGGGADGGDIQLWNRDFAVTPLSSAQTAQQTGFVLADEVEAHIAFVSRSDELLAVGEDELCRHLLIDGTVGLVPRALVRMSYDEPYAEWSGYAGNYVSLYTNYRLSGDPSPLERNTVIRVLADTGECYVVEVDGATGYMAYGGVSAEWVQPPAGGGTGGGSGGQWTEPAL